MRNNVQDETTPRAKPGRPLLSASQDTAMDNYNARLTAWHARMLRKLGEGNLSAGIRYATEFVVQNTIQPKE